MKTLQALPVTLAALWAVGQASGAFAQAQGAFPGTLACSPATAGSGVGFRQNVTVTIEGGRATYTFGAALPSGASASGTETGGGTLSPDRSLALAGRAEGRGYSYRSRYSGQVSGRGGMLTGTQTWSSGSRTCQLTLGDGRG